MREGESRRGFLRRTAETLIAVAGGGIAAEAAGGSQALAEDYYTFCGHTYTTASCPHPLGLPRVDANGYPLRNGWRGSLRKNASRGWQWKNA